MREGPDEQRAKESRKIVLIDIENMLFGNHDGGLAERSGRGGQILNLAEARRPADQLIVGCNPQLAFLAKELFPGARIVTGKGKNGADRALVTTIDPSHAAHRFSELCIVSGDHAFTELAREARIAGMVVRVVAPHAGLSTALRIQANTSVLLPEPLRDALRGPRSDFAA